MPQPSTTPAQACTVPGSTFEPPPIALYAHLPWCVRKCPYCDFNSHRAPGELPERRYVDALLDDLESQAQAIAGRALRSIFIGGGTPSLFSGESIRRFLEGVRARASLAPGAEVTLEANPGTAEAGRFAAYREAGVTRLSLGVQSFDDALLGRIGRIHDGAAAHAAIEIARAAGFDRINVDLMYALPGQDAAGVTADLRAALDHGPGHLSLYQLTLEPGTPFHRSPPPLPGEHAVGRMDAGAHALLAEAGYERYEISAHARAGERCAHNLNYWHFGDYVGIGAGAHGKLTDAAAGEIVRTRRERHPTRYVDAIASGPVAPTPEPVPPGERAFEFVLNAARLLDGFSIAQFERRTGLGREVIEEPLGRALDLGLVELGPERVTPTPRGVRFHNELVGLFMTG